MIYRFKTKQVGSGRTIEVQMHGPAGAPVDKLIQAIRSSGPQQGLKLDSIHYVGSIDTNFDGIVVPVKEKCATQGCEKTVDSPGDHCEECLTGKFRGWYSPMGNEPTTNKCVVRGCGRESTFHLCKNHAVPGKVFEIPAAGKSVVSAWLVERKGQMYLIVINDYSLGARFSGREAFKRRLHEQGYKIHHLISSEEQLETVKRKNPDLEILISSEMSAS